MTNPIAPLIKSQKSSPSKKVVIILPEIINQRAKSIRNEINAGITGLNEKIEKKFEQISRYGPLIKRVTVVPGGHLTSQESILETFQSFYDKASLRILIIFPQVESNSLKKPFSNTVLKKYGISHLIQIWYGEPPHGWFEDDEGFSNVKIVISDKQYQLVFSIIEDIILDIAMFNSFSPNGKKPHDLDFKIDISEQKVRYANSNNLSNAYGNRDVKIHYFSFASACRHGESFDYKKYYDIWNDFSSQYLSKNLLKQFEDPTSVISARSRKQKGEISLTEVKEIFWDFNEKGQIPMKDILIEINNLSKGSYIFIRIAKKCSRKKLAATVLTYFIGSSYRIGKWRILPFAEYDKVRRYSPFISIFKFTL